jgi:chromosome segregation ATPase
MVNDDHNRIDNIESWRDRNAVPTINGLVDAINQQSTVLNEDTEMIAAHQKWIGGEAVPEFKQQGTAIKDNHDAITNALDQLKKLTVQVESINQRVGENTQSILGHNKYHEEKLDPAMSALNAQLTSTDTQLGNLNTSIGTIAASVTDNKTGIGDIKNTAIPELNTRIGELSSSFGALSKNLETAFSAMAQLDNRIAAIEQELNKTPDKSRPPGANVTPPAPPTHA